MIAVTQIRDLNQHLEKMTLNLDVIGYVISEMTSEKITKMI